ncbi:hypothetical protein WICPIJ_007927 [Wickerhamomyces pijperi]|uniref:Exocyst complex component SEC15 n=1 Tax=Wickerhamomyces pijperi TaxID=599730 RepID=A0A9P8PYY1_WICPI|nr:hypothetical protein WICPIJ_007927 [Wickerhamomyces pijperi]
MPTTTTATATAIGNSPVETTTEAQFKDLTILTQSESTTLALLNSPNYIDQLVPMIKISLKADTIDDLIDTLTKESMKRDDELVTLIRSKEAEINQTAKQVSSISKHSHIINEQILDVNDHLSSTSNLTVKKKFELLGLKKTITKIKESEIVLSKVLQILELTDRTQGLIKDGNFFKALKNLTDLEGIYSEFKDGNRIGESFSNATTTNINININTTSIPATASSLTFLERINSSLPVLKKIIQDESISSLRRGFNSNELLNFVKLGESFDSYFKNLIITWDNFKRTNVDFMKYKINSSVEISLRASYSDDDHVGKMTPNVEELIDVGFIYDTFLVFDNLERLDFFKEEFNKELAVRRDKLLYPFINSPIKNEDFDKYIKESTSNLKDFLLKLSGFLILHHHLNSSFSDILTQSTRDLWENIDTKIYQHIKNLILQETFDVARVNELKSIIGSFYLVLEHFQLDSDRFYNLLIHCFKKFTQFQAAIFRREFETLARDDDSMPMIIHEYKLYRKITNVGWYADARDESEIRFPQVLPFSTIYPMSCAQLRNFITQEFGFFKDHFRFDVAGLQNHVVENVDMLFSNIVVPYFQKKINSITREELSQNLVNLENFIVMNTEVGVLLQKMIQLSGEIKEQPIVLKSGDKLRDIKKITENKLFEMIDGKINDLIEFMDYDWLVAQTNTEPNFFIKDIGDFLKNMFNSTFTNLPFSVKTLLLYRVFDRLATMFLEELNAQESLSTASILNFDKDISYIEQIIAELNQSNANSAGKSDTESQSDSSLQSMFLQLRQTINLLKSGSLKEYSDQTIRMRKYDQIKHDSAVKLINKLPNSYSSNSNPTTGNQTGSNLSSPTVTDRTFPNGNGHGNSPVSSPTLGDGAGRMRAQISSSTSMLFSKFTRG